MGSDWKQRANKRRDERRTIVPTIRKPSGSSKDTKKWCRGKVGRPHTPQCVEYNTHRRVTYAPDWRLLICTTCHKELDFYMPAFRRRKSKPPKWVK